MPKKFDRIIKGGTIIDGLRTPRFVSDIGISEGRIAYIGSIRHADGAEVIDAKNLIVAPGFIDLHTHYDSQLFWDPYCSISGWHGVTSVVIGNCGFAFAPCHKRDQDRCMLTMARNEAVPLQTMKAGMPWDWETIPEFLNSVERVPKGVNILSYVGLNPLMMYVMGLDAAKSRPATKAERSRMRELFIEALDAGACGFSAQFTGTGNIQRDYDGTPMITDTMSFEDLAMFAEVLRERGEGFIQIACDLETAGKLADISGRPVVWNILTVTTDQHGARALAHRPVLEWLNSANASGLRVYAQTMTMNVGLSFTMEDWNLFDTDPLWRDATLGTREEKLVRFKDAAIRRALRESYDAGNGPIAGSTEAAGTESIECLHIVETRTAEFAKYNGYTLGELAASQGKHVVDAFLDLVVAEDLKTQFETPPTKYNVDAMRDIVRAPHAIPGTSDGGAHTKFLVQGSYPTVYIAEMVREHKMIDLEEAHWRLSTLPAMAAGLRDRGVLREGMPADILIYDFDQLDVLPQEVAHDYPANEWRRVQRAKGYRYIIVNGETTFINDVCTGATPGLLLRHGEARQPIRSANAA